MKKKVCFLSHGLSNNGIDIFVRNVTTRLDGNKWDVSVILALDDEGKLQPREQEVLDAGVQVSAPAIWAASSGCCCTRSSCTGS